MKTRWTAARSRFGLRLIAVFGICSLLPILVFAGFAYLRARTELEKTAVVGLRREVKSASMAMIERLSLAIAELDVAAREREPKPDPDGSAFVEITRRPLEAAGLDERRQRALLAGEPILIERRADREHPLEIARRAPDGGIVVGRLQRDRLFRPDRVDQSRRYWVTNAKDELLFVFDEDGRTAELMAPIADGEERVRLDFDMPGGPEIAMIWPTFLRGTIEHDGLRIGMSIPRAAVLEPLRSFEHAFLAAIALGILSSIGLAVSQIRRRTGPLEELTRVARALEQGDYSARVEIRSGDELEDLARAFNAMSTHVEEHVSNLGRLARAGSRILSDPTSESVARRLVLMAAEMAKADLAVVFRPDLESGRSLSWAALAAASPARGGLVESVALRGLSFSLGTAERRATLRLERARDFDAHAATWQAFELLADRRLECLLVVPVAEGPVGTGAALVLGTHRPAIEAVLYGREEHSLRILADQAANAIRVSDLVANLRGLFEGVIQLTVQAIDEKSSHTGDHCRRVPILTELIADAVENAEQGPLKDFTLSPEQRYELKIAALLHDCGKVATPVHVMDKATKLETIMDRIEIVRHRAEILRRDLELEAWRATGRAAGFDAPREDQALCDALARLEDDFAFVLHSNKGVEFMDAGAKARIDEIFARHVWHDLRGEAHALLDEQDWKNLKIGRGTLNEQEREIIEGHASTTIRLLEALPFPPEMAQVPFIAGAHHEHLDGTGYPNGLGRDQLNMQARILGLADVFEALTAKDRPYKPGRSLSQTLKILRAMVDDGHIDGDLLEILVSSKVHLRYAAEYMDAEQIDGPHREELEALTAPWAASADRAD